MARLQPGIVFMDTAHTPTATAWCRVFYQHIAFPGVAAATGSSRAWHWLALGLLSIACMLPGLRMPLFEPDETRYAQIPREMMASNDWAIPRLDGEPYFDKPPMLYWLVAATYQAFGHEPWLARLVPSGAMLAIVLLTYGFGQATVGTQPAWRAALGLALAPGIAGMGRLLLMDGLLSLWILLAQGTLFLAAQSERWRTVWWLLAAMAAAAGIMTKGPICLILVLVPWSLHCWLSNQSGFGWRAWTGWWAVVVGLTLPWHVVVALRDGTFLHHYLWEHHVLRFLQPFDHVRGTFFYVPIVLLALFPLSLLLPFTGSFLLSTRESDRSARTSALGYWFWCAAVCLGFFSLSGCKLPTYILPSLAPLALVLGAQSTTLSTGMVRLAFFVALPLSLIGHGIALPWYASVRDPLACSAAWKLVDDAVANGTTRVVCYPRPCHAASLRLNRNDIPSFRSKEFDAFRADLMSRSRTIVLCTHRHSLEGLKQLLPANCRVISEASCDLVEQNWLPSAWRKKANQYLGETALGLCDAAVIEYRP